MIRAIWSAEGIKIKEMHAMVVECPNDGREDTINSDDINWECPDCKQVWLISELRRAHR